MIVITIKQKKIVCVVKKKKNCEIKLFVPLGYKILNEVHTIPNPCVPPLVHLMKLKTQIPRPIYFMLPLNITIITVIYRRVAPLSNGRTSDFLYYTTISGTIGASCRPVHNIMRTIF